jgi:archaemetzincin
MNVPPARGNLGLRPWSKEDVSAGQTRRDLFRLFGVALIPFGLGCRRSNSSLISTASALPAVRPTTRAAAAFRADDPAFGEDPAHFAPKRPAEDGDWLARFPETGTTFEEYQASSLTRKTPGRNRIVLQPLGPFDERQRRLLAELREYAAVFFDTPTDLAPNLPLPQHGRRRRTPRGPSYEQFNTQVILREVLAPRLPKNAVCYLGVTFGDLYPEPSWNYVFGQATLEERVGVYSLARYFPSFWGEPDTPAARKIALLRSFKVLGHETGHMFSLHHCVRYECLMNGSNSLEEMDRSPAFLCRVCLKKLAYNLRFDVRARYRRLRALYARQGLGELVTWLDSRLARIGA